MLIAVVAILASTIAVVSTATEAAERSPFSPPVFSSQENGAITLFGNSQMSCPASSNGCTSARSAAPLTSGNNDAINNEYNQQFLDLDGVGSTANSTSADLALPAGSVVLFAKLVWGGRRLAGSGGSSAGANFDQIKWRPPGQANYTTLTSTNTVAPNLFGTDGLPYQASIDVTDEVAAAGNGTFWVADIQAATGADRYAGWSIVLAYRNPAAPLRDLSIFEGFADVTTAGNNRSVTIPVSGFLTPATGTVNASVGFVTWEGDRGLTGEQVLLNNTQLSDASRPATNFFNSGITNAGVNVTARTANYPNNFGVDIATVVANGVLPNNATSANLELTTNREFYYPGIVTTQIDLYTPAFNPVSKTVTNLQNHSPSQIGDTLQYELTFTNTGADFADNSVVSDVLAPNQTYVPGSISVVASPGGVNNGSKTDAVGDDIGEYLAASRTVRVRVGTGASATAGGTLAPNATVTLRFRTTLDRSSAGTNVLNNATLNYRARTIARDFTYTGNVVTTPVAALADLGVTKVSSPAAVVAGGTVQYPITVTNNGPNAASGVSVIDTLPTGLTFVGATSPPGTSCAASGQVVTCTIGTMANGATSNFTVTATVPANSALTSVVNSVRVSSSTSDDVPGNDSASATTTITRSADLVATKSGPTGTIDAGAKIFYTIGATNNGPSTATTVRLTDAIPVGTSLDTTTPITSTLGSCAPDGGSVVCTVASLAPGATMSATFALVVGSGFSAATVTNTASVSSAVTDPNTTNNSSTVNTTIGQTADLTLSKAVAPNTVNAGNGATYTIVVTNNGPSDAQDVTVNDPVVAGINLTSAASSRGSCTIAAGSVSCAIGLLSPASSATITVVGTVDTTFAGPSIANIATASATTDDPTPGNNSATATLNVTRSADVSIVKSGPPTITAGGTATYSLTIANAGPSQATGVVATDILPAGLTFVSSTSGCSAVGTTVTCPVGTLGANAAPITQTFVVSAAANVPADVANTATVAATSADPNLDNNTSTFTSGGANPADISVSKSIAPATLVAGSAITYTMVVTNNGPSTATGVALTDSIPTGVTISGATWPAGTCTVAAQIQCAIGTVAVGAPVTITATGVISPDVAAGTTLANTVTVSSTSIDPTTSNNSASASGTVTAIADVGVLLTAQQPTIAAGSIETYKLRFFNNGPSVARNVVLTGQVPPGLIAIVGSSGGACVLTDQIVTCQIGDLPPGFITTDATDITLEARVDPGIAAGSITGTAFAGSDTPDSNPTNNQDPATIQVVTSADLAITKTAPAELVAGDEATYTLTVVNSGPSDATAVAISDTLPAAFTLVSTSPSAGTCSAVGQTVTCTSDRLPSGSSIVVSVKVAVSTGAPSPVVNTATVASSTTDPVAGNNSSTTSTPVVQAAHLTVSKSAAPSPAVAGASIRYTVTIANSGPSDATSVVLTDVMPSGVLVAPGGVTAPDATCTVASDDAGVECTFPVIPSGQTRLVTINANVPADTANGASITNTATITSPTPDPDPTGRTASVTTDVVASADVAIVKTPVGTAIDAGDEHSYQIAVTNNGPSVARSVTISDPLPVGTAFVSADPTMGTCTTNAGTLSCAIGDLTPGQVATVQLTILLAANLGDTDLTNTATAASPTPDPNSTNNSSSVTQRVTRRADLALTKVIANPPIVAGAPVTYSFSLTNNGPSDTINARILDPIPAGTTFGSASASDGGTCTLLAEDITTTPVTPRQVSCDWAQLAVGESRTATITLNVPDSTPAGTIISNVATADSVANDPTSEKVTVDAPVVARSDMSITKSLISGTPTAGGTVRWQLVVRNAGPSVATGVTVADVAPAGVVFAAVTTTGGTCTLGATPLCSVGSVAVGGTVTITLTGTVDSDYAAAAVTNTATVATTSTDTDPSNNTASITSSVETSADLVVTKTAGSSQFVAGTTATWTITVRNDGPSTSRSAVLNDPIPAGLTNVSATSTAGIVCNVGASVSCPLGDVDAGSSIVVTITGRIATDFVADNTSNTASATAGTSDPRPANNISTATTPVVTRADVRIAKSGPAAAAPGELVSWQLTVRNDGPSVAQAVVVTDQLPTGLIGARATIGGTPCTITAGTVRCELGAVPVDDNTTATTRVITITATIDPASTQASLVNTATVSSATTDPDPADNTASSTTTLTARADVGITKVADDVSAVPGTTIGWTIGVTNAGPSVARTLSVADAVPASVSVQSAQLTVGATTTACIVAGSDVTCAIGDLSPGTLASIQIIGLLDQGVTASPLSNTATLTTSTPDPSVDDHIATATTPVVPSADVQVRKSVDQAGGAPVAGGPIRFLIGVTNNGPSAAGSVVVDDALPASIDFASVTVSPSACVYTEATGSIRCPLGTVAANGTASITVDAISLSDAIDVTNTATVATATPDPVLSNNSSTATAVNALLADVAVTKTGPPVVLAGERITWELTVSNAGPSVANDIVVTDTLPTGVTDVQVDIPAGVGTCTAAATCSFSSPLAVADSVVIQVSALVPSGTLQTSIANSVAVSSSTADSDGGNNTAAATTPVARQALLRVTKLADPAPFVPGREAVYTITIDNDGPSDAAATLAADTLDPILVPNGLPQASQGTCTYSAAVLNCALGIVPAGGQVTVRIPVRVDPAATVPTLTNTATVSTATPSPPNTPPYSSSVTSDVTPLADLTLTKSGPDEVTAGTPIAWNLLVTNAGPSVAADVVVVDNLPPDLGELTIVPSQGTCTRLLDEVTCQLGNLAPGAGVSIQMAGDVPADATVASLVNVATVSSPAAEPGLDPTEGREASKTTTVVTSADVRITKSVDADAVVPGEAVEWTITVGNAGPSVARDVLIVDTLPPGLANVAFSSPAGVVCDDTAATCNIATLLVGADEALEIVVTADMPVDTTAPTLTNVVTASAATTDPDTGNNEASITTPIRPQADLQVTKTAPTTVVPGTDVAWTISVVNTGPSVARSVTLSDPIPAGVTGVGVDDVRCDETVLCELDDLLPGGPPIVITVTGALDADFAGDTLVNTATVASTTPDPSPDDNTSTATSVVDARAALVSTKTGSTTAVAGGPISWTVSVTNNGPSAASAVEMIDPVPAGVLAVSVAPSVGTCDATVSCRLGTIAVGATVTIEIDGTVDASLPAGQITNRATVTSPDETTTDPGSVAVTDVTRSANVTIDKSLTSGGTVAGSPVSWTLTVANDGPSTAENVVVVDDLPDALRDATATPSVGSCTIVDSVLNCSLGTLPAAGSATIAVSGSVAAEFRGELANTATVSSTTTDPNSDDDSDTVTTTVGGVIDLAIAKSVDRPRGLLGTTATFTISVSNLGPSTAGTVVVDDQLPTGVTFLAARPAVGTFDAASLRWAIGTMLPGASTTMQIDVSLTQLGTQTNVATVGRAITSIERGLAADDEETRLDNNRASASIEVYVPDELPTTGSDVRRTLEVAAVLLAAGFALILADRRRKWTHTS